MARTARPILAVAVLAVAACLFGQLLAFVAPAAPTTSPAQQVGRGQVSLRARGGGEYDVSDADIEAFYAVLTSGSGGDVPKRSVEGGVGYGVDEMSKVADDGKGWVWLAAEMSPGGLAVELVKSVP